MATDKRRRFKNEIGFPSDNKHVNIVTVIGHRISTPGVLEDPFYVMRRYDGSLRQQMKKTPPESVMKLLSQMLDGVEAAHLHGDTHRD